MPVDRGTWGRVCDPSVFIDADAIARSSSTAGDHFGSNSRQPRRLSGYDPSSCALPQWNTGPPELMYKPAMERGAAAVANANADVLIVVDALYCGRDLTAPGTRTGRWVRNRESRAGISRRRSLFAEDRPRGTRGGGRLVYAVHDYSWYVTPDESTGYDAWAASRTAAWGYLVSSSASGLLNEFGVNHASLDAGKKREANRSGGDGSRGTSRPEA